MFSPINIKTIIHIRTKDNKEVCKLLGVSFLSNRVTGQSRRYNTKDNKWFYPNHRGSFYLKSDIDKLILPEPPTGTITHYEARKALSKEPKSCGLLPVGKFKDA